MSRTWIHAKRLVRLAVVGIVAIAALAELAYWTGWQLQGGGAQTDTCAVLVLGYPNDTDGSPGAIQRLRVAAGVAAWRAHACSRIVVSGAAVHNRYVEAVSMAKLVEEQGVPAAAVVVEKRARSTWENVACSLPSLQGFDRIFVASDSLHAYRGRRYLCRQQPSLCDRTAVAAGYEPFSLLWWKVPAALYELRAWLRDRILYERASAVDDATCPLAGE